MTDLVVAKFGGTSVADFDAMNRSVDVARLDENTRVVVLSASAGVTNLLVALAEGLEPAERFEKLESLRQIQFNILERLRYPNVIREEIERLLENITTLAEAASLAAERIRQQVYDLKIPHMFNESVATNVTISIGMTPLMDTSGPAPAIAAKWWPNST